MQQQMKKAPDAPATTQPAAAPAATMPAESGKPGVLDKLQQQMQANPMIEATESASGGAKPKPAIRVGIDPKVLGIAPGMDAPKLRREGDFVINRRGRLVPSSDGLHALFHFESDGSAMADPPMVLVPCQTLQSMEGLIQERGDRIVFMLSGQVLEYRGVNYLLPTMMKLDIDRGNLKN